MGLALWQTVGPTRFKPKCVSATEMGVIRSVTQITLLNSEVAIVIAESHYYMWHM